MNEASRVLLHCSLIEGIGPATMKKVSASIQVDALTRLYTMLPHDLAVRCGVPIRQATLLVQGLQDTTAFDKECALLAKHDIDWICQHDERYPELLKHIHYPPIGLYVKGQLSLEQPHIAFVGARKANEYAFDAVKTIVPTLSRAGWNIVSGGALGVDACAHDSAVQAGGLTTVILGSGLLRPYPHRNKKLFESVVATGGALVSSFPLLAEARPEYFPARNRIIAGLSKGCVVVQAAAKSGALITAKYALDQGRDVFTIPGSIFDPLSAGCFALLRSGAKLVARAHDICEEFTHECVCEREKPVEKVAARRHYVQQKIIISQKKISDEPMDPLLKQCMRPASADDLVDVLGVSLQEIQDKLFTLQLDGKIEQHFTGLWQST